VPEREPVECVEHQGDADSRALLVGIDCQSLDESLALIAAGDRIAGERTVVADDPPGPVARGGPSHFGDGGFVECPFGAECTPVDDARGRVVVGAEALGGALGERDTARGGVLEEGEFLHGLESDGLCPGAHGVADGVGADPLVARAGHLETPLLEVVGGGWSPLLHHDEMRGGWLERPGANGGDGVGTAQYEVMSGARQRQRLSLVRHRSNGSVVGVTVLFATHPAYLEHLAGPRHPERPERLGAVIDGVHRAGLGDALVALEPEAATRADVERVHGSAYLDRIEHICLMGGGRLDPDTYASEGSYRAAMLAAGAGLTAVRALRAGRGDAAFCAVRPPGHHAAPVESMGFCFVNNIAVVAASLAAEGERVLVFDIDAHHGNGTQDAFYADQRVLFVSMHQWPLYPGTGWLTEIGEGDARGCTMNVPMPPGATGDVYLRAFDDVIAPVISRFAPTWVLVSAGFDAHRDDPITELGLSAGDYRPLVRRALEFVPAGRRLVMLEGGYDLDALAHSSAEVMRELAGVDGTPFEAPTEGGPGNGAIARVREHWELEGLL